MNHDEFCVFVYVRLWWLPNVLVDLMWNTIEWIGPLSHIAEFTQLGLPKNEIGFAEFTLHECPSVCVCTLICIQYTSKCIPAPSYTKVMYLFVFTLNSHVQCIHISSSFFESLSLGCHALFYPRKFATTNWDRSGGPKFAQYQHTRWTCTLYVKFHFFPFSCWLSSLRSLTYHEISYDVMLCASSDNINRYKLCKYFENISFHISHCAYYHYIMLQLLGQLKLLNEYRACNRLPLLI